MTCVCSGTYEYVGTKYFDIYSKVVLSSEVKMSKVNVWDIKVCP